MKFRYFTQQQNYFIKSCLVIKKNLKFNEYPNLKLFFLKYVKESYFLQHVKYHEKLYYFYLFQNLANSLIKKIIFKAFTPTNLSVKL